MASESKRGLAAGRFLVEPYAVEAVVVLPKSARLGVVFHAAVLQVEAGALRARYVRHFVEQDVGHLAQ